jgi:S1-C subfamily serine protease
VTRWAGRPGPRRAAGVIALLAIVATACGAEAAAPSPTGYFRAAVGIEASGCSLVPAVGSGAVLAPERVMTSAHTVAGATDLTVIDSTGIRHAATLVGFDPRLDLAVLSVPGLGADPLPVSSAVGGETGWLLTWRTDDRVVANPMTVSKRLVVSIEDIYVDEIVERRAIELDADVSHGDSGAAVVTTSGEVVGIVYAASRSRRAGFALDGDEIATALAAAGTTAVDAGPCT